MAIEIAGAATLPRIPERRSVLVAHGLLQSRLSGVLLVVLLLLLWEASARLGWVASQNWPPVSRVLLATGRGLVSGDLSGVLAASLLRMAAGYVIGAALGVALGLLLGTMPLLARFVTPVTEALRPLPLPALVPPLILFLGLDDALKITVVALAVFFPVLVSTFGGVRSVDEVLLGTARTFGTSGARTLVRVVLPAALPSVFAGLRISLSLALVTTVVAEMIAGSSGIGYFILQAQYSLRPAEMYAAVICIAASGYALNAMFVRIEAHLLAWHRLAEAQN